MIRSRRSVDEVIAYKNTKSEDRQGRMSNPYWRSAIFRNWLVALLILAALGSAPLVAARLPSELFMGLPSPLMFLAVGMPVGFLILAIFKISLQQALDRNHELDKEDQLQRRRVPKRLKSFPVKAVDVSDADTEIGQTDPDMQQQQELAGQELASIDQTSAKQAAG